MSQDRVLFPERERCERPLTSRSENGRFLGCGLVVHGSSSKYGRGSNEEGRGDMEVKKHDRGEERKDNGDGSGKAFEDVVRVLDDDCGDEAAKHLDGNRGPRPTTKIAEKVANYSVRRRERRGIDDRKDSRDKGEEGELNVADPQVGL